MRTAAHDLRNLVAAISAEAQLGVRDAATLEPFWIRFAKIENLSQRANRILEEVPEKLETIEIAELIRKLRELLKRRGETAALLPKG